MECVILLKKKLNKVYIIQRFLWKWRQLLWKIVFQFIVHTPLYNISQNFPEPIRRKTLWTVISSSGPCPQWAMGTTRRPVFIFQPFWQAKGNEHKPFYVLSCYSKKKKLQHVFVLHICSSPRTQQKNCTRKSVPELISCLTQK